MADNNAATSQEESSEKQEGPKVDIASTGRNVKVTQGSGSGGKGNVKIKKTGGDAEASVENNVIHVDFKKGVRLPEPPAEPEAKEAQSVEPTSESPTDSTTATKPAQPTSTSDQTTDTSTPDESEKGSGASTPAESTGQNTKGTSGKQKKQPEDEDEDEEEDDAGEGEKDGEEGKKEEKDGEKKEDGKKEESGDEKKDGENKKDEEKKDEDKKGYEEKDGEDKKDEKSGEKKDKEGGEKKEGEKQKTPAKVGGSDEKTDQQTQPDAGGSTPPQLGKDEQSEASNGLNQDKQAGKGRKLRNFAKKVGDSVKEGSKEKVKDMAYNLDPRNIVGSIGMDQLRIRREIKEMDKELRKLMGDKADAILKSSGLRILSWIMPGVVGEIRGALDFGKNTTGEVKVKILHAKILKIKAIITTLQGAEIGTSIVDATIIYLRMIRSIIGFFPVGTIIGLFLIPLGAVGIPMLWTWFYIWPGKITKIIDDIVKKLEKILEPLEKRLKKELRMLYLRRRRKQKYTELQQTNLLSISSKRKPRQRNTDQSDQGEEKPAANDNQQSPQQKAA